jgi:hypothetical protein
MELLRLAGKVPEGNIRGALFPGGDQERRAVLSPQAHHR